MPEDKEKTENLIDVGDADEKATEVDLDKKAEGGEIKDEKTTQDTSNSFCTPFKYKCNCQLLNGSI